MRAFALLLGLLAVASAAFAIDSANQPSSGGGGGAASSANFTAPVVYGSETLTYATTVNVDFSTKPEKALTLTGNVTITTSNLAAGRRVRLIITADSTTRNLTLPTTWHAVNGFFPAFIPPNKQLVLDLDSTSTTDAGMSVTISREGFAGERKQMFHSTFRDDAAVVLDGLLPIPGTRRAFTMTWGSFIECRWEMTGVTNLATPTNGASDFGAQLLLDATISPEYDWHYTYVIGPGGGTIWHVAGNEQIAVSPGLHNVQLMPRVLNGAGGETSFDIFVGPHDNMQDNAFNFTCDEVVAPQWTAAQIPQVAGTDMILVADWTAEAGVTKNGSNRVSAWVDQSGHGNDLAQATSGLQPLWVDNCQNGLPCIRFDPTRKDAFDVTLTQGRSERVILIGSHNHQTTDPPLTTCTGTFCVQILMGSSSGAPTNYDKPEILSAGVRVRTASTVLGPHMLEFRWTDGSGGNTGIRTDLGLGTSRAEEGGVAINSSGTMTRLFGDDGNGTGYDGDVYEIQIWRPSNPVTSEELTVTDDKYLRDSLNRKWAIYTQPNDIGG